MYAEPWQSGSQMSSNNYLWHVLKGGGLVDPSIQWHIFILILLCALYVSTQDHKKLIHIWNCIDLSPFPMVECDKQASQNRNWCWQSAAMQHLSTSKDTCECVQLQSYTQVSHSNSKHTMSNPKEMQFKLSLEAFKKKRKKRCPTSGNCMKKDWKPFSSPVLQMVSSQEKISVGFSPPKGYSPFPPILARAPQRSMETGSRWHIDV